MAGRMSIVRRHGGECLPSQQVRLLFWGAAQQEMAGGWVVVVVVEVEVEVAAGLGLGGRGPFDD